jgi:hypothetical protein
MPLVISRELANLAAGGYVAMRAATALKHAAMQPGNAGAIVAAGGLPPLVALLHPNTAAQLQDEAAAVLRAICLGNGGHRAAVCDAGAVPPLILLLASSAAETQEQAAGLLGSLAMQAAVADAIARDKGVGPLLDVCCSGGCDGARLDAANALLALAAASDACRRALIEAGARVTLDALQREGRPPSLQHVAAAALQRLPVPPLVDTVPTNVVEALESAPPCPLEPVPGFLQGAWRRRYIRRTIDEHGTLGEPSTAPVWYVQTAHAFVDVRARHGDRAQGETMAFAGVITAASTLPPGAGSWAFGGGKRVSWHACHNWDPAVADFEARWHAALADGAPYETEDIGDFVPVEAWSGTVWRETDPDRTLEEEWERVDDGGGRFFAARRGSALLCVAGDHFGFVSDSGERPAPGATGTAPACFYAVGRVGAVGEQQQQGGKGRPVPWRIEMCTEEALEGTTLILPGASAAEWTCLPGCTLMWPLSEAGDLDDDDAVEPQEASGHLHGVVFSGCV